MAATSMQVVFAFLDAWRRRDIDDVTAVLHADVVHQGVTDDMVCHGRDQVLENVRMSFRSDDDGIDHLELIDAGAQVVLGLAGPRFRDIPDGPVAGQIFVVHTVRDGVVVQMQDYLTRSDAITASGAIACDWT